MKIRLFDAAALIFSISVFLIFLFYGISRSAGDGYLLIQDQSGESVYSLEQDRVVEIEGPVGESVVVIEDGTARFESSDCRDDLCVLMGSIDEAGEWAACLPNRVFISIEGDTSADEADTLSY